MQIRHHRAVSAAENRKIKLKESNKDKQSEELWQYLLSYGASDDQIRILPYNRVVRKLPISFSLKKSLQKCNLYIWLKHRIAYEI